MTATTYDDVIVAAAAAAADDDDDDDDVVVVVTMFDVIYAAELCDFLRGVASICSCNGTTRESRKFFIILYMCTDSSILYCYSFRNVTNS